MMFETTFNQKFLRGVQMLHGAVFSKSAPLAAGGKKEEEQNVIGFTG
jgi:hypothetical protein